MTVSTAMDKVLVSNFCNASVHDHCTLRGCFCDCHVDCVVWGSNYPSFLSTVGYEAWRANVSDVKVIELLVRNAYNIQEIVVSDDIVARLSSMISEFARESDDWAAWRFDARVEEIVGG